MFKALSLFIFLVLNLSQNVFADMSCRAFLTQSRTIFSSTEIQRLFDAYEPFDFEAQPITNGIELEGYIRDSVTLGELKRKIKSLFSEIPEDVFIAPQLPDPTYFKGDDEYVYKIERAGLPFLNGNQDLELISPVLRDHSDVEFFYRTVEAIKEEGARSYESEAGVHIHVGFPDAKVEEVALLLYLQFLIEEIVYKKFAVSSNRERAWARKISDNVSRIRNLLKLRSVRDISKEKGVSGIEIVSLNSIGTVEFRFFNSSFDPFQIEIMRTFVNKLVKLVRTKDPRLVELLIQYSRTGELDSNKFMSVLELDFKEGGRFFNPFKKSLYKHELKKFLFSSRGANLGAYSTLIMLLGYIL